MLRFDELRERNTQPAMLRCKAWLKCREDKRPADGSNWTKAENQSEHAALTGDFKGIDLKTANMICVDLDKVYSDTGELSTGAKKLVDDLTTIAGVTYVEKSISGAGLHLFYTANNLPVNPLAQIKAPLSGGGVLELYTNKSHKYILVTGNTDKLDTVRELADGGKVYEHILLNYGKNAKLAYKAVEHVVNDNAVVSIDHQQSTSKRLDSKLQTLIERGDIPKIIEFMRAHSRSAKADFIFWNLYETGDTSNYNGDTSSADLAFMNYLPFWTGGNAAIMRKIFLSSALGSLVERKKGHVEKYIDLTINKALASWNGEVYQKKDLSRYQNTDAGNAERFCALYGDIVQYIPTIKKWLVYTGKRYEEQDEEQLYTLARKAFTSSVSELLQKNNPDMNAVKWLTSSHNTNRLISAFKQVKGLLHGDINDFDTAQNVLNVANGTVNLVTGELTPHNSTDKLTKITRGSYEPNHNSNGSLWERTVASIIPDADTREYFKRFIGYALTGKANEEIFVVLIGEGGTGKSTLIETIAYTVGDYASTIDIENLLSSRNDGGDGENASPQIAGLVNKRLVLSSEAGAGRRFKSEKLKIITGQDAITARRLHCAPFTFTPKFTLVLNTNYIPAIADGGDSGIFRRMVIIPFNHKPKKANTHLKEMLRTPESMQDILKWIVEGAINYHFDGLAKPSKEMRAIKGEYFNDNDTIGDFLAECTAVVIGESVTNKALYAAYVDWLTDGRLGTITQKAFITFVKKRLLGEGVIHTRSNKGYLFRNLKLVYVTEFV